MKINSLMKRISTFVGAFAMLSITFVTGCASQHPLLPGGAELSTPDYTYIIGAGDNVNVFVWRNPEVSRTVPVRPDGKITMPLVEDLVATGKTPKELARDVEKVLSKYIKDPIVTIMVTGFVGPYTEQIRIVGQAAKPQALPYKIGMSALDAMIAVGGLTEFAAGNNATVVRIKDGKQQQFGVRLDDLIKDGEISANVALKPGDIMIIPESWF